MEDQFILEATVEAARRTAEKDLTPTQKAWEETQKALRENQMQMDEIVAAIATGKVQEALWDILNQKATQLKID
jgi:vacuolar-type H+-ATPase subunit H